jgi:hypothetical protein
MEFVINFLLQQLFRIIFSYLSSYTRVKLEMCTETHVNLHVWCPLLWSDVKKSATFIEILHIKFHEKCSVVLTLLHADRQT